MPKFYFVNDVARASGWQRWSVEADTLAEAKIKKETPGCPVEFDEEEVEVTESGPDQWEDDR